MPRQRSASAPRNEPHATPDVHSNEPIRSNPHTPPMPRSSPAPPREERESVAPQPAYTAEGAGATDDEMAEEVPIAELMEKVVIHSNKPIENLPATTPPELKIIGRCVTFMGDTTVNGEKTRMRYVGLVGSINKDTCMLLHVTRFTDEDYDAWLADSEPAAAAPPPESGRELEVEGSAGAPSTLDPFGREDVVFDKRGDSSAHVRNRLQAYTGTMGPVPYMTFSRRQLHDVDFSRDPKSSFYSLFSDPSKTHFDMQCLRMFVRRYLVHTSQGNNPRQVPLRAFVTVRCACPNLDNTLLKKVALEELEHVLRIDRDIRTKKKKKRRTQTRAATRFETYEAPPGLFRRTGILYLTGLPKRLFTAAAIQILLSAVMGIFFSISFGVADPYIVQGFLRKHFAPIIAAIVVCFVGGFYTLIYSTQMRAPLTFFPQRVAYLVKLLFMAACIGLCCTAAVILGGRMSNVAMYNYFYDVPTLPQICTFYAAFRCSGYSRPCTYYDEGIRCYRECDSDILSFGYPCEDALLSSVRTNLIPLMVLSLVMIVVVFFDFYLMHRLARISAVVARELANNEGL